VYKIFGPGNQYITCAKMLVAAEGVAIDMPAGPSEVAILADETCDPNMLQPIFWRRQSMGKIRRFSSSALTETVIDETKHSLQRQLSQLPRREIVEAALTNSKAILVQTLFDALELINEYAPEHLIIACRDAEAMAENVRSAGSVFLGNYSPESVGDYASGTNHTLPTNGFAAAYSGVSLDSFFKKITFQQITKEGLRGIAETVQVMAEAEGLRAHANAVSIRLKN
jgi:histidinol dehydrogenase